MAVLSDADRAALTAEACRQRVPWSVSKAGLRAAYDAADAWADTNALAYNAALPLPFRTVATPKQKAQVLMDVLRRRYEVT